MERKLKKLFEYQKFGKNAKLDALIAGTHARYDAALSDEDLGKVAAAGELTESEKEGENDPLAEWYGTENENPSPFKPGSRLSDKWFETPKQ